MSVKKGSALCNEAAIDAVEALLPGTQCKDCGYDGCRPYAQAMLESGETIAKCKPGGQWALNRLAEYFALDPKAYLEEVLAEYKPATVARIEKEACIGCTKCIEVCPIDAIMGAAKALHEVLPDLCSGCGLCVPVCPTDCIVMENPMRLSDAKMAERAQQFQGQYQARNARKAKEKAISEQQYQETMEKLLQGEAGLF